MGGGEGSILSVLGIEDNVGCSCLCWADLPWTDSHWEELSTWTLSPRGQGHTQCHRRGWFATQTLTSQGRINKSENSDNVTYIFQISFREIVTYRWMRGREEETKGLAQNFTHWYPAGAVVKNPPSNAGNTWDTGSVPGSRRCLWSRKRQPTPVFLPGKSHGQRSLVCSPWDHKKLALTERLSHICVTRDNLQTVAHLTCVPCNGFSFVSKWNWRWKACQYILKKFS